MISIPNDIVFAEVAERVARGESATLRVAGSSMSPLLKDYSDMVTFSPMVAPPEVGDVALYRYRGRYIMHRLVKIEEEVYIFQGDNCTSREVVGRDDILAVVSDVRFGDGREVSCDSKEWKRLSRRSLLRRRCKTVAYRVGRREARKKLRPWYFLLLAILMWAPLNGLAEQFPNYVLGLRFDHIVHASIYLLCAPFLMDLAVDTHKGLRVQWWRYALLWAMCAAVGIVTETGQLLLPYRGFDVNDLAANFMGSTLGWMIIGFWLARRRGKKRPE